MKKLIFLFVFLCTVIASFSQSADTVKYRYPNQFPVDNTPSDTDAFYTQEGKAPRKIFLSTLKQFFGSVADGQVDYNPVPTGNAENRNSFVKGLNGNIYFIDEAGNSVEFVAATTGAAAGEVKIDTVIQRGTATMLVNGFRSNISEWTFTKSGGVGRFTAPDGSLLKSYRISNIGSDLASDNSFTIIYDHSWNTNFDTSEDDYLPFTITKFSEAAKAANGLDTAPFTEDKDSDPQIQFIGVGGGAQSMRIINANAIPFMGIKGVQ